MDNIFQNVKNVVDKVAGEGREVANAAVPINSLLFP